MSREENRGMINAYQKMLENGSAFKEVDLTMHETPSMAEAEGALGDRVDVPEVEFVDKRQPEQPDRDYSQYDSVMEQRINSLRNKVHGSSGGGLITKSAKQELALLKKKVADIEEAIMLIMDTHEKLLG